MSFHLLNIDLFLVRLGWSNDLSFIHSNECKIKWGQVTRESSTRRRTPTKTYPIVKTRTETKDERSLRITATPHSIFLLNFLKFLFWTFFFCLFFTSLQKYVDLCIYFWSNSKRKYTTRLTVDNPYLSSGLFLFGGC